MTRALSFTKDGEDLREGIELRNSRANPFGWSTHEVWLVHPEPSPGVTNEEHIADIYCGEPTNLADGYGFRFLEVDA